MAARFPAGISKTRLESGCDVVVVVVGVEEVVVGSAGREVVVSKTVEPQADRTAKQAAPIAARRAEVLPGTALVVRKTVLLDGLVHCGRSGQDEPGPNGRSVVGWRLPLKTTALSHGPSTLSYICSYSESIPGSPPPDMDW